MSGAGDRTGGPDRVYAELLSLIDTFGWAVRHVGAGDEPGEAPFSYTVGLTGFDHPEIVTQGLPFAAAHAFLNDIGAQVRDGRRFTAGSLVTDLTEGGTLAFIGALDTSGLTAVEQTYGTVAALQMIWCDSQGHLPWEHGYQNAPTAQPLLGPLPESWSRGEADPST